MPHTTSLLKLLAFALACTLLTTPVPAQVNEGIVTGRAVDANNGILQGARVELRPKGVSRTTRGSHHFGFIYNQTATWPSCGSNVPRLTSAFPINSSLIQRRSSHASHH